MDSKCRKLPLVMMESASQNPLAAWSMVASHIIYPIYVIDGAIMYAHYDLVLGLSTLKEGL